MAADRIKEIEEDQQALRKSIEESKRLADYSERLIRQHRGERERDVNP